MLRPLIACMVLAGLVTSYGCASVTDSDKPKMADANKALLAKQHAQSHFQTVYAHGKDLLREGRFAAALGVLDTVLQADPLNAEAINARGVALFELGHVDSAIKSFERAIELAPGGAHFLGNLGLAFAARGKTEHAVQAFLKALRLDPDNKEFDKHFQGAIAGLDVKRSALWAARRERLESDDNGTWQVEIDVLTAPKLAVIAVQEQETMAVLNLRYPDQAQVAAVQAAASKSDPPQVPIAAQPSLLRTTTVKTASKKSNAVRIKLVKGGVDQTVPQRAGKKVSQLDLGHIVKVANKLGKTERATVLYAPGFRQQALKISKSIKSPTIVKAMPANKQWDVMVMLGSEKAKASSKAKIRL